MKKWSLLAIIATLLLTGCQNPAISEAEVNRKIEGYISQHQNVTPFAGQLKNIAINYDIGTVDVDFRSQEGGQVITQLGGTLEGKVKVLGRELALSVPFSPEIASRLRYADGKIYLQDLRVLDWGGNLPRVLKPHTDKLEVMAAQYLQKIPIYTLNHSMKEKLAASVIKRLEIKDDQLVFVL